MKVKGKQLEDTLRTSSAPFTKIYSSEFVGSIKSESNDNIVLEPSGTGKVTIKGNATTGSGQIVLNCEQNSHGIIIKGPPHSATASYTLVLPDDDGSANQVLKTDGSGNLSWVDQSGGGGGGLTYTATSPTSNFNAVSGKHYSVNLSGASATIEMTLPSASSTTAEVRVKLIDATQSLTVKPFPNQTLDAVVNGSVTLNVAMQSITLVDNGSNGWEII